MSKVSIFLYLCNRNINVLFDDFVDFFRILYFSTLPSLFYNMDNQCNVYEVIFLYKSPNSITLNFQFTSCIFYDFMSTDLFCKLNSNLLNLNNY